jgi:uncharacterized protein YbbK (DUF523 family)
MLSVNLGGRSMGELPSIVQHASPECKSQHVKDGILHGERHPGGGRALLDKENA